MIGLTTVRCPGDDRLIRDATELLSRDELDRHAKFINPEARRAFAYRRAARRLLLSRRVGISPAALEVQEGDFIKPRVEGLSFNCSASGNFFLLAIAENSDIEVGADVETRRNVPELQMLVSDHMPELKNSALLDAAVFLEAWTRKEAYLKALGVGLSVEPSEVAIPLTNPCAFSSATDVRSFTIESFSDATDYLVAVAYEGVRRPVVQTELDFAALV
ncbi:MAG: 4'-phosphopantetheinyl transferase superfamily protein [Bdellovibrionota bacterium]